MSVDLSVDSSVEADSSALAIELTGITKRFPGVIANDNVNLSVKTGEIHAICGENGAGKSTLMKILYGMQKPDEGVMKIDGNVVNFDSPTDAIERGIGMVHQHFMLADHLTVLENVILGSEPAHFGGKIDFVQAQEHLAQVAQDYGLEIDVNQLVETLDVGERQRVEIIKVLYRGAKILILDEPTAVLVPQEVEALFENMRELKANGATIIFIDHKLDEVLEISDSITVLRRGKTITSMDNVGVSAHDLGELMVGAELPVAEKADSTVTDTVALSIRDLNVKSEDGRNALSGINLDIHKGETLGIAGVEGNGQGDLVSAIMGTVSCASGSIKLLGREIINDSVRKRREAGIAYVPEDRHHEGLLLSAPLRDNTPLGYQTQAPYSNGWLMDKSAARKQTERIREIYDVRTPNVDVSAHALSGGNQQKLIIGRELESDPNFLIAAHPTRGIDVGAQAAVWEKLRTARAEGLATLLISADLDELIGLSDTIVVMLRGEFVARLSPEDVTPRDLGAYMTGAARQEVA